MLPSAPLMDPQNLTLLWLGAGVLLALSELVVPGGVMVFLGLGGVLVAGARWLGLLESPMASFTAWTLISVGLIASLRGVVSRWSGAQHSVQSTNEDVDAFGQVAVVSEAIHVGEDSGRIRFRGTTWPARCLKGVLEPGTEVRIVDRENVSWIVEPASSHPIARRESTH